MPLRGPGIANQIEYGYIGGGDVVMGLGDSMSLTQDFYCDSLTMTEDAAIETNGYRIYVVGDVLLDGDFVLLTNSGQAGADGDDGGLGGLGGLIGTIGGGFSGGDGANDPTPGGNGLADPDARSAAYNGSGGDGGEGGTSPLGVGGSSDYDFSIYGDFTGSPVFAWRCLDLAGGSGGDVVITLTGGAGGGGGSSDVATIGGGGGGGGGVIYLSCFKLKITGGSTILARGGNGGVPSVGGNAAGGGGQGGVIVIHAFEIEVIGSTRFAATGGAGGLAPGTPSSSDGEDGDDGNIFFMTEHGINSFVGVVPAGTYPNFG